MACEKAFQGLGYGYGYGFCCVCGCYLGDRDDHFDLGHGKHDSVENDHVEHDHVDFFHFDEHVVGSDQLLVGHFEIVGLLI